MIPLPPWLTFLISGSACWLLIFPLRKLLGYLGIVDQPNARSSHTAPVLRGGGIAIVMLIAFWLSLAGDSYWGLLLPLLSLAAVSLWDDWRPLPARIRFTVHALATIGTLIWLTRGTGSTNEVIPIVFLPVAFIWITGYTNAFNFMDGINGLAGGQAVITALGTAMLGHAAGLPWTHPAIALAIVIAGTAAGFLPHNFPQARVFMGDAGSASLGFLLAILTIWVARDAGWWLCIPLALLHANFILDTGLTLLRRIFKGERWYEAHREHFYQRLVRAGRSHLCVTNSQMILQVPVMGLMNLYLSANSCLQIGLVAGVIVLWLGYFAYAETLFRAAVPKIDA